MKPILIGIAGGSASGKSSIAARLKEEFSLTNSVVIIRQDDYYKDQSHLTMEERVKTNYDHPFAFDNDLLIEHLNQLMNGKTIEKPTYDYTVHNRSEVTETVTPCDVIVLEGLFVLESEKAVQQLATMGYRNVISTGGKTISKYQIELITRTGCTPILALDKDVEEDELKDIANMFMDGITVYAVIDKDNVLDEKESPSDNPQKWQHLIKNNINKIKGGDSNE